MKWVDALKSQVVQLNIMSEFIKGPIVGKGNFAEVHKMTRISTQSNYALKSYIKNKLGSRREITNLLQEIEVLRAVDHPNIIKLYEVYESTKLIHMVQPLL